MLLDIGALFTGERKSLPIDCILDFSDFEFRYNHPFAHPVTVRGEVSESAGVVSLKATVDILYRFHCDRCLDMTEQPMQIPIEHVLVRSKSDENDIDSVKVDNSRLLLDDVVIEDLLLYLPQKNLCSEDCRGICPKCGRNLNRESCDCKSNDFDPRFDILKQFIQSD